MRKQLRVLLLCCGAALICQSADAQSTKFYAPEPAEASAGLHNDYPVARLLRQDIPALLAYVRGFELPLKGSAASPHRITIPLPDGRDLDFIITETALLEPALAAANPDLKTFKGASDDGAYRIRLTTSPMGMMAFIAGKNALYYATPLSNKNPETMLVYDAKGLKGWEQLTCATDDSHVNPGPFGKTSKTLWGDATIRTYRLAVATTGEYTTWAGSQANALTQVTATINAMMDIYNRDFAINFTLVCPASIRFTNASTDPYSVGSPSGTTLSENQATLTSATYLGSSSFDVGMVFCALGSGGLASKPSACASSFKAQNASGLDPTGFPTGPSGPVFISTVAHETGHQFDADHSFAANTGGCSGNTNGATGWEPGGGSTIMAYAGTCTGLAYQLNSDFYFHGGNVEQISNYMINTATCATTATNTNTAPTVSALAPSSYTIPVSTPFRLTAMVSQTDNDLLTYNWDQKDAVGGTGTSSAPAATNTTGPMMRSFPPSLNKTQYFPSLAGLVGVNATTYEVLPSVARTMNFRLTVHDNVVAGGRTAQKDVSVITASCATPFAVTSQSSSSSFTANGSNTMSITWNTATACATCTAVDILFSTDGGRSFPYTLLANATNNGSVSVTVPNLPTDKGRIMVQCANNIHFNINAANQTITSSCSANGSSFSPSADLYAPNAGNAVLNQSLSPNYGSSYGSGISGSITTSDADGTLVINNAGSCMNYTGNLTHYDVYQIIPGSTASYSLSTGSSSLVLNVYDSAFLLSSPCRNWIASDYIQASGHNSSFAVTLNKGKVYQLVISSFSSSTPSLPAAYTISISGGTLYSGQPNPGAGFNYSYIIVNNSTGNVVAVQSTGNMSTAATYPSGSYTIYGISCPSTASSLNTTYAGTSFASMRTAILNQSGGLCGSLSSNSRLVTVSGTPLPILITAFDGHLTGRRQALLYWDAVNEEEGEAYELQRSYDGVSFKSIAQVRAGSGFMGRYSSADNDIAEDAARVIYRLKVINLNAGPAYSGVVRFNLSGTQTSMDVLPNPVPYEKLSAEINLNDAGSYRISITDLTGRVLKSQQVSLQAGRNVYESGIAALSPGIYLLSVSGNNVHIVRKFIRQ